MTTRAIAVLSFDEPRDVARWLAAAAIVLALHASTLGSYLLFRIVHSEGSPAAPIMIVNLSPVPVAPSSEQDIAPGPQMQESLTQPEPEKVVKEEPPPKENPVVAELLQVPKPEVKPEIKPPAPRTTAAPRNVRHTAQAPAAPAPGSEATNVLPPSWISLLFSHLMRYRQYPSSAQSARQEGVVMVNFTMDRNGRVLSRHLVRSSGVSALDAEALAMIDRAQPLPSFPSHMTAATRSFTAPIKFSLR
jgi:periplasmic protein TonB